MFERASDFISSMADRSWHAQRLTLVPSTQTARQNKYGLSEHLENGRVRAELNFIESSPFFHVSDRGCILLERHASGLAAAGPQKLRRSRKHGPKGLRQSYLLGLTPSRLRDGRSAAIGTVHARDGR